MVKVHLTTLDPGIHIHYLLLFTIAGIYCIFLYLIVLLDISLTSVFVQQILFGFPPILSVVCLPLYLKTTFLSDFPLSFLLCSSFYFFPTFLYLTFLIFLTVFPFVSVSFLMSVSRLCKCFYLLTSQFRLPVVYSTLPPRPSRPASNYFSQFYRPKVKCLQIPGVQSF